MNIGLLILRVVAGTLFAGHGAQKLFGWFEGPGIDGAAGMMHALGYRPGRRFAAVAALTEVVGGALFALGLLTPLAAAMIIGLMVNAYWSVHREKGLWITKGGYEYNVVLATIAAAIGFTSAGRWSLDNALGLPFRHDWWGVAAVALGLVTGGITVAMRTREPEPVVDLRDQGPRAEVRGPADVTDSHRLSDDVRR